MKSKPPLTVGILCRGRISGRRKADVIKTIKSFLLNFEHTDGRTYRDGLILFFLPVFVPGSLQLMEALKRQISKLNTFCTCLAPGCLDPKSRDFPEWFIRRKQAIIFVSGGRRERRILKEARSKKKFTLELSRCHT